MKIVALTCTTIGLLGALMAALTVLEVSPGFILGKEFGGVLEVLLTTAFWGGLSGLLLLAAIALSIIAPRE